MFVTVWVAWPVPQRPSRAAGEITRTFVNLRAEATTDSDMLTPWIRHAVEAWEWKNGWYRVRLEGQTGNPADLCCPAIEGMMECPMNKYYAPYVCGRAGGICRRSRTATFLPKSPLPGRHLRLSYRYCSYYG